MMSGIGTDMNALKTFTSVIFLLYLSNPLYSEEFSYQCDVEDHREFSLVFDVDIIGEKIIHTYSVNKNTSEVRKVDRKLDFFFWDKDNESVWAIEYRDPSFSVPYLTTNLFNFKKQTLIRQVLMNDITTRGLLSEDIVTQTVRFKCFSIE